jgi:hypothetical protein
MNGATSVTDWVSLCVFKKPRERGDRSPRWAAEPEMMMIMIIIIIMA